MNEVSGRRVLPTGILALVLAGVVPSGALAQAPSSPASAVQASPSNERPAAEFGFEHRFRSETFDNVADFDARLDDRRNQFRFRTRLWVRAPLGNRVEVYAGINNESRSITTPNQPTVLDEVIFEHLYVDWKIDSRHTLRAGRQNVMRGEGLVLFDANPLDGSRAAYFDALLFTRALGPKSTIELMAIANPHQDRHLPRLKAHTQPQVEWDEQAFGAYLNERRLPRTAVEAYFLHKTERNDHRGQTHRQYHADRSLEILGGRAVHQAGGGWSLTGELTGQRGGLSEGNVPVRAWGGYAYAKKSWTATWKPAVQAGYITMSGDDPQTSTIEEWHPVFARWPKWSELYIYALVQERGPAYWANLGMYQAEFTCAPARPVALRVTYYKMRALHASSGSPTVFGAGTDRGDMLQARFDFTLNGYLRGHVLYEGLWPGDFTRAKSSGYFFRTELIYTFRKSFSRQ